MPYKISYFYPAKTFDRYAEENGEPIYKTVPQMASMEKVPDDRFEELFASAKAQSVDGEATYEYIPYTEDEARNLRDKLLAETDWTQTVDAPVSSECQEAYQVYRQALRDVPQQENFPNEIVWPEMPVIVKV